MPGFDPDGRRAAVRSAPSGGTGAARPGEDRVTRPALVLGVLAAAQFVVVLSTSIVNVALPSVGDGVGLSGPDLAWVINAYGLAFGALLLLGGRVADLAGRRRVLLAGLAVFLAASFAAALASTPWLLITARAVQGVGAAAVAPAALSLVMRVFPAGPGRGRALGVWGAVSGAGGAAGVLLGGLLTESMGWRSVFHATALGAAAVLAAGARWVPGAATGRSGSGSEGGGSRSKSGASGSRLRGIDLTGALTVTLGLVALVHSLTAAGRSGWTDPWVLGTAATAVALLVLFARAERRHPAPLLPPHLLTRGSVAPANLVMALLGAVWVGLFFFLPLYQQQVLGDGPLRTGLAQLPLAAANMAGAFLAPRLARRFGASLTLVGGMAALSGGLLWLSGISADGTFTGDVLGPTTVIGLGLGIAFVQLTGAAVEGVPPDAAGIAGGLVNTTRQVGGALGLAVLGTLAAARTAAAEPGTSHALALTEGYRTAFLASAAVAAAGTALAPLLARTPKPIHPHTQAHPPTHEGDHPMNTDTTGAATADATTTAVATLTTDATTTAEASSTSTATESADHTPALAPIQAVDAEAPVVVRLSITVHAPLADVWALHTDIDGWADWNPDIDRAALDGTLAPGARFRWLTHGLDITSTVHQVVPGKRIVWGGPAQGIDGVHAWTFQEHDGVVTIRTDESWSGPPVDAQRDELHHMLTQSLEQWLRHLKARAERP